MMMRNSAQYNELPGAFELQWMVVARVVRRDRAVQVLRLGTGWENLRN